MIPLIAASLLLSQTQVSATKQITVETDPKGAPTLLINVLLNSLEPNKISPRTFPTDDGDQIHWEFPWLTTAFVKVDQSNPNLSLRMRVYSQDRQPKNDLSEQVARMAMRMWQYNAQKLKVDQPFAYNRRILDIFLCWGGKAGGEQRFDVENVPGVGQVNVNTIYIYDLKSFTDPVEMAREVAHEYGHAVLPGIAGFETPEDWANGYLGERLYLRAMRDGMLKGQIPSIDVMGATGPQLDTWVTANVDPLVTKVATAAPQEWPLSKKGQVGMNAYMGLALYMNSLLPSFVFSRTLQLTETVEAKDYLKGIEMACQEAEKIELTVPPYLAGKPIWVPLAGGRLTGAAIVKKSGTWAQVIPGAGHIYLIPAPRPEKEESPYPREVKTKNGNWIIWRSR